MPASPSKFSTFPPAAKLLMTRSIALAFGEDLQLVSQLRRLINRHSAELSSAEPHLTSADLLTTLYLATRLGVTEVTAHASPLSSALTQVWQEARKIAPVEAPRADVSVPEMHLLPFHKVSVDSRRNDDGLLILYGVNRRSLGGAWIAALQAVPNAVLLPVFGRSLALWGATSCIVSSERNAGTVEDLLDALTLVFNDASFDPLMLSELCERLRLRVHTPESGVTYQNDETAIALGARLEALQAEMQHLRHSNAQQQRAIALLNAAHAEHDDA